VRLQNAFSSLEGNKSWLFLMQALQCGQVFWWLELHEWKPRLSLRVVASGGPVVPVPHLKSVPPHFTFGPPVAAYINTVFLKCDPPSGFWPLLLVFGSPYY